MPSGDVVLRQASAPDAHDIARILRAALASFDWMPTLHTPDQDLLFVRETVLAEQHVIVAVVDNQIVGFVAVKGAAIKSHDRRTMDRRPKQYAKGCR